MRPRRRWPAVVMTTAVVLFAYGSILIGLGGIGAAQPEVAGAALGTGLVLTPIAFGVAAFISVRNRAVLGTFLAWAAWFAALPIAFFDVMVGLVAGYAAGAAIALAMPPRARWMHRAAAVIVLVMITLIGVQTAPAAVVLTVPLIIVPAIAFADDVARGFPAPDPQSRTRTKRSS